jgi:hypothetical protein
MELLVAVVVIQKFISITSLVPCLRIVEYVSFIFFMCSHYSKRYCSGNFA